MRCRCTDTSDHLSAFCPDRENHKPLGEYPVRDSVTYQIATRLHDHWTPILKRMNNRLASPFLSLADLLAMVERHQRGDCPDCTEDPRPFAEAAEWLQRAARGHTCRMPPSMACCACM